MWKYVMMKQRFDASVILFPIIFPDKLVHSDVARVMGVVPPIPGRSKAEVDSAGTIEHLRVIGLGGESETLGIASKLGDVGVIENYSYQHGLWRNDR